MHGGAASAIGELDLTDRVKRCAAYCKHPWMWRDACLLDYSRGAHAARRFNRYLPTASLAYCMTLFHAIIGQYEVGPFDQFATYTH